MKELSIIDEFASQLSIVSSKSSSLGETISKSKLVKKFLTSLPRRFIHIVASTEQVLDLKTSGFEDVVGRLKAYEERIQESELTNEQNKLLFNKTETYSRGGESSRGGGCGGREVITTIPINKIEPQPQIKKSPKSQKERKKIAPKDNVICVTSLVTLHHNVRNEKPRK